MSLSLRTRLMTGAWLSAVLFMLALLPALQGAFNRTMEQIILQRLAADAITLISAASVEDGQLQMPEKMPDEEFNLPEAKLLGYVYDQSGNLLWQSRSTEGQLIDYMPAFDGGATDFLLLPNRQNQYYVYDIELGLTNDGPPFSFITMMPSSEFQPLKDGFHRQLYNWLGGGLLILLALLWAGLTWGFRALRGLGRELDQVESGALDQLSDQHPRELLRLTRSLNRLLNNERRQRQRYRDSLGDLAHSLKTPLSVLQSMAEEIGTQPGNRQQAQVLQGQIGRMSQQIDYQLRRASLRKSGLIQHKVTLVPLLQMLGDTLDKVYGDKRVELSIDAANTLCVPMERGALLELLGNLLENAYRLCLQQVRVSARLVDGACEILVEDDGPGIPAARREQITERGQRLDTQHPGQGIGMSVVKDIIDSYEGELLLGDSSLGGALFLIRLQSDGTTSSEKTGRRRWQRGSPNSINPDRAP